MLRSGLVGDLADDVGAERTVGAADRQGLAVPAVRQARGDVAAGDQLRLGHGAGDRHRAFAADVLLREDGEVVDVDVSGAAAIGREPGRQVRPARSEEHTSELQSLMRISYAVFCLKKKKSDTHVIHHKDTKTTTPLQLQNR